MPIKTLQYELSNWRGMDRLTAETECDPHFWYDIQNFDIDDGGSTIKRRGSVDTGLTVSGTIHLIYDHQAQQGITAVGDNQRTVVVAGTVLNVISNFNTSASSIVATFSVTNAIHYAVTDDVGVTYLTNENGGDVKLLTYLNSAWIFRNADLVAPSGTISATVGTTTSVTLAGTFQAVVSYVDAWGNESPLSNESNEVLLANKSLNITVPVSSDPTVDYVKFYVLGPAMSDFQFSGTHSNTSGTYSHSMSMAQLMSGDLAPDYLVPFPDGKYVGMYEDMLLVAGDINVPDTVWCSNRQFHRQWGDNYARCVSGDGQPIRGFGDSFDRKMVLKSDSLFICEGESEDTFRTRQYSKQYGAVSQGAVSYASNRMAFYFDDGMYVDNGQIPEEASRILLNYQRTLDWRNLVSYQGNPSKLVMATYKYYKQVFMATREYVAGNIGENDVILVWNYLRNAWTKHKGNVPSRMGSVQNADDLEYLFGGNASGKVWWFTPPNYGGINDDRITSTISTTISCYAETPWMNFPKLMGSTDWERTRVIPRYLEIYASGEPAAGESTVDLDCGYYVDFDSVNCVQTFSTQFNAHAFPTVRPYKKTISYGGKIGTYRWVKWRFEHSYLGQHIKLHKLVFGNRFKPSID